MKLEITHSAHLFWNRGLSHKAKGDFHGAISDFDQALKLHMRPNDKAAVICERGNCQLALGHTPRACMDFEEAVRLNPSSEAARNSLGLLQLRLQM
jgi:tetratricopeptide (TPR) repeat protein